MKHLMLIADGFEDVEAIATEDVLTRGGETVVLASVMGRKEITTKCGNLFTVNTLIEDVDFAEFDSLIIPGGPGSFRIMPGLPVVSEAIRFFADHGKLVAAICAAPHLVGKLGYFRNRNFTVHPGFETPIIGGTYLREKGVVKDGNFITAKSMYYSIPFGLAIYAYYHGTEAASALERSCMGEK